MHPKDRKKVTLANAEKRLQILDMRRAGHTYAEIAKAVGLTNGRVCQIVTNEYKLLADKRSERAMVCLEVDLERLESLTLAHWDNAMAGDIQSGKFIESLIARRQSILGYGESSNKPEGMRAVTFVTQEEANERIWNEAAKIVEERTRKAG